VPDFTVISHTFGLLPLPFWLALGALLYYGAAAWKLREDAIGLPMLMVVLTVALWYFGDALYNDYTEYIWNIGPEALTAAWWQVLIFMVAFGAMTPGVHHWLNGKLPEQKSSIVLLFRHGVDGASKFQDQLDVMTKFLAAIWAFLMVIALIRTNFDLIGNFMPYLGLKAEPWMRGRVGGGFDSLMSMARFVLVGLSAGFGVVAALSTRKTTRYIALAIYILTAPTFLFDRTRSTMLAVLLPGFCAWCFLRLKGSIWIKLGALCVGFFLIQSWLKFVIENRTHNTIAASFAWGSSAPKSAANMKHQGLSMLSELGHVNMYMENGSYRPNWGARYFAEVVNPIPRALWPGKPMIGIDYAMARGMAFDAAQGSSAGVGATMSTGMIGQGVVNFGTFFGPIAAAFLMAFWASVLARQDLLAHEGGRIFLYAIGFFLTFNMGRDITLLVLYPFCFGYLLLYGVQMYKRGSGKRAAPSEGVPDVGQAHPV
jgi:hypothetical protein